MSLNPWSLVTDISDRSEMISKEMLANPDSFMQLIHHLVTGGDGVQALSIFADLRFALDKEPRNIILQSECLRIVPQLPVVVKELFSAITLSSKAVLSEQSVTMLKSIRTENTALRLLAAELLGLAGADLIGSLYRILATKGDRASDIVIATKVAMLANKLECRMIQLYSLSHRFPEVRREALIGLARRETVWFHFHHLAEDNSPLVKECILELMEKVWSEWHVEALLKLAADTSEVSPSLGEEVNYPLARKSSEMLLNNLTSVDSEAAHSIESIIQSTADNHVRLLLLRVLIRAGSKETKNRIAALAKKTDEPVLSQIVVRALDIEGT